MIVLVHVLHDPMFELISFRRAAKIGRIWPIAAIRFLPWGKVGPLMAIVGPIWPSSATFWPVMGKMGPTLLNIGSNSANIGPVFTYFCQICTMHFHIGQNSPRNCRGP